MIRVKSIPLRSLGYIILILTVSFLYAHAQEMPGLTSGRMTGQELAQKVFDRDRGKNSIFTAQMVLVAKSGNKRNRQFTNKRVMEAGLERRIIRFTAPADIAGTGFLTIEKPGWETEQFLFLPALRRTRRIVSSQKSSRFVNSDFTYEDMERHPVDDYVYNLVGTRKMENLDCYALEVRPKEKTKSQYSLTFSLIETQSLVPVFVQYFDKKGTHIKTYKVLKLGRVQGIWTESAVSMEDLGKGHKTYIKLESIRYNSDLGPEAVSIKSLENY